MKISAVVVPVALLLTALSFCALEASGESLNKRSSSFNEPPCRGGSTAVNASMRLALNEAGAISADRQAAARAAARSGWLYYGQGSYLQAQPQFSKFLELAAKSGDRELLKSIAAVKEALACIYLRQGKFNEAESLYLSLADAPGNSPEKNSACRFAGLLGQCNVLCDAGKYVEARQRLSQLESEIARVVPPLSVAPLKPNAAVDLLRLNGAAVKDGFLAMYRKRLQFDEQVASSKLYLSEGNLDQAESSFQKICNQFRTDFGTADSPAFVPVYAGLGRTCLLQGKLVEAQRNFDRAMSLAGRDAARLHDFSEDCLIGAAEIQIRQGHPAQAQSALSSVMSGLEKNLGSSTPPVAECLLLFAEANKMIGKLSEAETQYRLSLAVREKLFGVDSDKIAPAAVPLAELLLKQEKDDEARQLFKRSMESCAKLSCNDGPLACQARVGLAGLEMKQHNLENAEKLYSSALRPLEHNLPPGDPGLLDIYERLGQIYLQQNKAAYAEPVFKSMVSSLDQVSRQDETLVRALNGLSTALVAQQKWDAVEGKLARILKLLENNPSFHLKDASALKNYPEVLRNLNKESEAEQISERLAKLGRP